MIGFAKSDFLDNRPILPIFSTVGHISKNCEKLFSGFFVIFAQGLNCLRLYAKNVFFKSGIYFALLTFWGNFEFKLVFASVFYFLVGWFVRVKILGCALFGQKKTFAAFLWGQSFTAPKKAQTPTKLRQFHSINALFGSRENP